MTGEVRQEHNPPPGGANDTGTTTKADDQDKQSRVGKYGGDDGALEHENAEKKPPAGTEGKKAPSQKPGA